MNTSSKNTQIEVIESNLVKYKKQSFLFFSWYVKVSATKIRNDIVIETNDEIENIYFNGKLLELTDGK